MNTIELLRAVKELDVSEERKRRMTDLILWSPYPFNYLFREFPEMAIVFSMLEPR